MRPLLVVVRRVLGEDRSELPFVEDQQPVQALAANGADPPLGVGVRPRSSWWAAQYLDSGAGEDGAEAVGTPRGCKPAIGFPSPVSALTGRRAVDVCAPLSHPISASLLKG